MKIIMSAALAIALFSNLARAETMQDFFPDRYAELSPEYQEKANAFDFQQGEVTIQGGIPKLNIGPDYYFIEPAQANLVIETFWGNPEGQPLLGMISPHDISPYHNGEWALTVEFDGIGFVSDEEAADYNHDDLLMAMKSGVVDENE